MSSMASELPHVGVTAPNHLPPKPESMQDQLNKVLAMANNSSDSNSNSNSNIPADANDYSRFDQMDDPDDDTYFDRAKQEKEAGNRFFKMSNYYDAISRYTEVCTLLKQEDQKKNKVKTKQHQEETNTRIAALSNRAACHLKLHNFKKAIEDCDTILKQDPKHAKALFRRSQAHTSKGMNEMAYRDVLLLLDFDPTNKSALKSKKKLEKELHSRSRDAIKSRIDKDKYDAAEKIRKKEKNKRKIKMQEAEKKRIAERLANSTTVSPIKMAPPVSVADLNINRDDIIKDESTESGELMRGYKKTKDGRTTSYFNVELTPDAKILLGDTAPKKLNNSNGEAKEVERKTSTSSASSAWNSNGTTFEERDRTSFCTDMLKELVKNIKLEDAAFTLEVTGTKKVEGDGSMLVVRGSRRFIWDYSFGVSFKISLSSNAKKCKGTLQYIDFTQDKKEPPEVMKKLINNGFKDSEDIKIGNRAIASLRARMEIVMETFRSRCMAELE